MNIYLVGGAIRDKYLKRSVTDKDWVVVGATPEQMLAAGYQAIGKDFPVFLHPESKEEYALARTERKVAAGYQGFTVDFDANVTLVDDLKRRDLTINAMAENSAGELIDPFNGLEDLNNRILRHVSDAFVEDPVRLLRLARFAACFHQLGFTIHLETLQLLQQIVADGEVNALVAERVWQEINKALQTESPAIFFKVLRQANALAILLPELDLLWPDVNSFEQALSRLTQAAQRSSCPQVRFAALWSKRESQTQEEVKQAKHLCKRLKVSKRYAELVSLVAQYHHQIHQAERLEKTAVVELLERLDAYRKPDRFRQILLACELESHGPTQLLQQAYDKTKDIDVSEWVAQGLSGLEIKANLHSARSQALI